MLKEDMIRQLNDQLNLEFYSANLYLQMSAWCSDKGFEGAAAFMMSHSREEMAHMQRLFKYVSDTGALPLLGSIEAPRSEFESLAELFNVAYQHEQLITEEINKLADLAMSTKITPPLTSCSGTWPSSMKKKRCSNRLSISWVW